MQAGLFMMPTHPPERSIYDGNEWDLQVLRWADEMDYHEAWLGEHLSLLWETNPAPDLTIAQAIKQTKRIKIGPGGHCLSHHNPGMLAARVAFLDHLAQGRYMLGCAAGIADSDRRRVGLSAINREMMQEALDTMVAIWTADGPLKYEGKFWTTELVDDDHVRNVKPFQKPHPPISIAAVSPNSSNLRYAGSKGYIPLSLIPSLGHWDTYAAGAKAAGLEPDRGKWRFMQIGFVADTDEEAYRWSVGSHLGRAMREYVLPAFDRFGILDALKGDSDIPTSAITPEWLADNAWLVGSPERVTEKLDAMYRESGGFGVLCMMAFDYSQDPEPYRRSLELLTTKVLPNIPDLTAVKTA